MGSIVIELQKDALNPAHSISDLLRKAFVVARKLNIKDYKDWISSELTANWDSYPFPEYRKNLPCSIKVKNPYHGLQPLRFKREEDAKFFEKIDIPYSISELEEAVREHNGLLEMELPQGIKHNLENCMAVKMEPCLIITTGAFKSILDKIRNQILDWALNLEEEGILGSEINFTDQEVKEAETNKNVTHISIHGSNNQLQLLSNHSSQEQTVYLNNQEKETVINSCSEIMRRMSKIAVSAELISQVETEVSTIKQEMSGANVERSSIINKFKRILGDISTHVAAVEVIELIKQSIHFLGGS